MSLRTACTYDCPDACGLLLRDGHLAGDPDHPITRGFTCQRIQRHLARLASPTRLREPRIRQGDRWLGASWDAALDLAAERLRAALPEPASIVYLQGGGSLGLSKKLVTHAFRTLGPITSLRGGPCGEAGEEAQRLDFGDCADHDYTDLSHSQAVVLWGRNPVETGPHLIPFVREAQARGAPVTLVDVRRTPSAKLADRFVCVTPGGDGALALAVLRSLHESQALDLSRVEAPDSFLAMLTSRDVAGWTAPSGASTDDVDHLASLYAERRPVATWVGWGLQRRSTGGAQLRCLDALGLLTGNVGVAGGGVNFTSWRRRGLDVSGLAESSGRTLPSAMLGTALLGLHDPDPRFVYVCAANPVGSHAGSAAIAQGLRRCGFVVVADAFETDTTATADLVLPVALMLEEDDAVGSYAHHHVATVRACVAPPAGARTDLWIARELRRRAGLPDDPVLEDPAGALARMTAPWFTSGPVQRSPAQVPVPFADRFPTPSGKARLLTVAPVPSPADPHFPLRLLSVSNQAWQTTQLTPEQEAQVPVCHVHPGSTALGDGAWAELATAQSTMRVVVRHDGGVGKGVAVVYRGGPVRLARGVNALLPERETDVGGGVAFYDEPACLSPAPLSP